MLLSLTLLLIMIPGDTVRVQSTASEANEKSCREHPRLTAPCFTVHGRLSIYNGTPARRLWRIGTKRVLGISEQRFAVAGYRNIPKDIESKLNQDVAIYGDFLVCPFTRSKPGEMQLVCIEEGKNVAVRERNNRLCLQLAK